MDDSQFNPDPNPRKFQQGARGLSARRKWIGIIWAVGILMLVSFLAWFALSDRETAGHHGHLGGRLRSDNNSIVARHGQTPLARARQTGPGNLNRRITQRVLNYGDGDGELGMVRNNDQTPVGPESFTVDSQGNILIADRVNHRIVVCAPDGTFLRAINVPGITLNDVTTDSRGQIFVYDQSRHTMYQVDPAGGFSTSMDFDPADIDTRGYFHISGESVYFADAAARDVLVATLKDGGLAAPDSASERRSDGIHGRSGRVYTVSVVKGEMLSLGVRDPNSEIIPKEIQIALPDILAARFVGEDLALRYYVHVERLVGGNLILEVLTFSAAGEPLGATALPENDYSIWTSKLMEAGAGGTIVQFLPGEEQARLNLLSEE